MLAYEVEFPKYPNSTIWLVHNRFYGTWQESILYTNAGSNQGPPPREVKCKQLALQTYLWQDRFIGTFGSRRDDYRARISSTGALTDINGTVTAPALPNAQLFTNGFSGL